jgi:hypothetical protein
MVTTLLSSHNEDMIYQQLYINSLALLSIKHSLTLIIHKQLSTLQYLTTNQHYQHAFRSRFHHSYRPGYGCGR